MEETKNPLPAELPGWLVEAQRVSRDLAAFAAVPADTPAAFGVTCRDAADRALALARMRSQRRQGGFLPVSLGVALAQWARAARIDLAKLLDAWRILSLEPVSPHEVRPLADLCRRLGLSWREARLHLGIGVAERHGGFLPLALTRQQHSARRHDPLTDGEEALRAALEELGPAALAEWEGLTTELTTAYDGSYR